MKGMVLTGDALYCQRQLCQRVVDYGGDYLFIVKINQRDLYNDIKLCFDRPVVDWPYVYAENEDWHGNRLEIRRLWVTDALMRYLDWPGHRQVIKVESTRCIKGKETTQVRYAVTSLGPDVPPDKLLGFIRGHWGIENRTLRKRRHNGRGRFTGTHRGCASGDGDREKCSYQPAQALRRSKHSTCLQTERLESQCLLRLTRIVPVRITKRPCY